MSAKPPTNVARWIRVETNTGPVQALAFALNRKGRVYAGKLSPDAPSELRWRLDPTRPIRPTAWSSALLGSGRAKGR